MLENLSLHHLTLIHASPRELIEAASRHGFGYCGIRLIPPRAGDPVDNIDRLWIDRHRLLGTLAQSGVKVLDIETVWLTALTDVAALSRHVELGALLGARYLLVSGNDSDYPRLIDNLGNLAELASSHGMTCMLEFIPYSTIRNLVDCRKIIADVGRVNICTLVDSLHLFRSGYSVEMLQEHELEAMPYMQLCDGPAQIGDDLASRRFEARQSRLLPGDGEIPLAPLVRKFYPHKVISIEAPSPRFQDMEITAAAGEIARSVRAFLARLQA